MSMRAAAPPSDEDDLEERLCRPTEDVTQALVAVSGDVIVIGAGGKMGPSLTAMVKRAADSVGDERRVIAVSRWSDARAAERLAHLGVQIVRADLLEARVMAALPDAPNVIYMAGQKFGTSDAPSLTWMTNTVAPALVADRYRESRIVAFSTGNVYALSPVSGGGSKEDDALAPVG
ncbi:MAG: NmrA family NAD(P)-binding protein, partial [Gemmatimonadaceae bacterium]